MSSFSLTVSLGLILMVLGLTLSKKEVLDREKVSPFECGFSPKFSARLPFSIRFFLVAIIFLIFDVELVLLFPMVAALSSANLFAAQLILMFFIFILLVGLYHEINQGSLSWAS